jgi:hypothetical protein
MLRLLALALVTLVVLVAVTTACTDEPTARSCTGIPAGGCPRSHGVACEDPSCEAVYLCRANNVWEIEQRCPAKTAPIPGQRPEDAGSDAPAAPVFDAAIDAPPGAFGGPGCDSLQSPECALGLALSCGEGCCGCEDLFVCEAGGWTLWGACADGGLQRQ